MRILFVADVSIIKVIGGAERVLFEQTTRMALRRNQVHILTRRLPIHRKSQDTVKGVTEWRYNIDKLNSYQNCKNLFESLNKKYKFDCINFHQPFSAFSVIRSRFSRNIHKIYTCHSLSFEEYISRNSKPCRFDRKMLYLMNVHLRKQIEKYVIQNSDHVVVLSYFTQQKLQSIHNISDKKISVIPGGVDLEKFHPASDKKEIRKQLGLPCDKFIMLTVRNLVARMGLDNLILAVKKAVSYAPGIYLIIGGDGKLKNDLMRLSQRLCIDSIIRFAGFIPEDKLPAYYRMADLFVLPTYELEGFGLVTLESMASGVPVIGTPVGGTLEILGNFDNDYLFKDTNPESIAESIIKHYQKFSNDPKAQQNLSDKCRSFVLSRYSWEKNLDDLELKIKNQESYVRHMRNSKI